MLDKMLYHYTDSFDNTPLLLSCEDLTPLHHIMEE